MTDGIALRRLVCAIDVPDDVIERLFERAWSETPVARFGTLVEETAHAAIHIQGSEELPISPARSPALYAAAITLAAMRIETAEPFNHERNWGSPTQHTTTSISCPLAKNPGGSAVLHRLRRYHQEVTLELFRQYSDIRRLLSKVLLSPINTSAPLFQGDQAKSLADIESIRVDDGKCDHVRLPAVAATHRCLLDHPPTLHEAIPPVQRDEQSVRVPIPVVEELLWIYTGYGFDKLAHTAYHTLGRQQRLQLVDESLGVEKHIHRKYKNNHLNNLYGERRYDTAKKNTSRGFEPSIHNENLATIVDVVRWSENLTFDEYYTAGEIFEEAKRYFPPPHRPPNNLRSVQRVSGVLRSAASVSGGTNEVVVGPHKRNEDNRSTYRIKEPRYTPLYTSQGGVLHRWDAYRRIRINRSNCSLPEDSIINPRLRLPEGSEKPQLLSQAKGDADRAVVGTPHIRRLHDIEPAVHPNELEANVDLTYDDVSFLSRVAYAQNGFLEERTLLDGMAEFDKNHRDESFSPDIEKLLNQNLLDEHDKQFQTLYSVSEDITEDLGMSPVSHEGYGEKTSSEKALHKYGTELLARYFEQRDDVDEVHRYVELWRFGVSGDLDTESGSKSLRTRRVDVVGVGEGKIRYAGEIQDDHDKPSRVVENWHKLRALGEQGVETVWLSPQKSELTAVLEDLRDEGCIDGDFPSHRSVTECRDHFADHGIYNDGIRDFGTFRSRYRRVDTA